KRPNWNVHHITDSYAYLVVEMQPHQHELDFLRPGPLPPSALARSLSSWTTARHRQNAAFSLVYHASGLTPAVTDTIAEADRFVARVGARLKDRPKPYRDHPYWLGAIAAHHEATGMKLARDEWRRALGLPGLGEDEGSVGDWL